MSKIGRMNRIAWTLLALLPGLGLLPAFAAAPAKQVFIHPEPSAAIYHDGWIDLNKSGTRDPYEDPAVPVEKRNLSAHIAKWLAFPNALQSQRGFHSLMLMTRLQNVRLWPKADIHAFGGCRCVSIAWDDSHKKEQRRDEHNDGT